MTPLGLRQQRGRRRLAGRRLVGRICPAGDSLHRWRGRRRVRGRGFVLEGDRVRRRDPVDEVVDLVVVERPAVGLRPDGHDAVGVTADVAPADRQHVHQVGRVEVPGPGATGRGQCVVELGLVVQRRADATLALGPVALRTVGQEEGVAVGHAGDVLLVLRLGHGARTGDERHALLEEPVDGDEQDDEEDEPERPPPGGAALAHDAGGALFGQLDAMGTLAGVESLQAGRPGARRDQRAIARVGGAGFELPPRSLLAHMHPVGDLGGMTPGWPSATGSGPSVILDVSTVSTPDESTVEAKRSRLRGAGPSPSTLMPRRS